MNPFDLRNNALAMGQAAGVLEAALGAERRDEAGALILAEAALAPGLSRADLRNEGAALRLACHHALREGATQAAALAGDLARRWHRSCAPRGPRPRLRCS